MAWVRFGGFNCSWDVREQDNLSAPISGGLICSPGYPWRAAEVNCAASENAGCGGEPCSLACLVYSRAALEKNISVLYTQCCHNAVKVSLHHSSSWGCAL